VSEWFSVRYFIGQYAGSALGRDAQGGAWYHRIMTQLDVLYRYEGHPTEAAMFALGNMREVYGIRRITLDDEWKTIRVEYDATRLTRPIVFQLLRRAGIQAVEELPLVPPQEAAAAAEAGPAQK
jgi:hypothetical protein